MTNGLRSVLIAVATVGLVAAPVAAPAFAAAPNTAQVLFFSNEDYTDPEEEDTTQIAALQEGGATVTVFDGADGTGAAWSTALAGKHFLVIPESDPIFNTAVLDDAAEQALLAFVNGGGHVILPTAYQPELLSFLTGIDYTSVWSVDNTTAPGQLVIDEPALPAEVTYSDAVYPVITFDTWTPEQFAAVTPIYVSEDSTDLYVGQWTVGTGTITVLAYDWYPGDEPEDIAGRATWNQLLRWLTYVPAALAATGAEFSPIAVTALGVLVLAAGAGAVVASRRAAQA